MHPKYLLLFICFVCSLTIVSCKKSETENVNQNPNQNQQQSFTVKGALRNCAGSDITNGLIVVSCYRNGVNTEYFFDSVYNGSFSLSIQPDNTVDSVAIFAMDLSNLKLSDTFRYKLQDTLLNVNIVNVCSSDILEYFRFKVDNSREETYTPLYADSLNLFSWNYTGGEPMTGFKRQCYYNCKTIEFQFDGHSVGTFPVTGRDRLFIYNWYSFNMPGTGSITYTSYGAIGQLVEGFISVPFIDNTDSLNHLLTGSFRLKRKDHL